MRNKVHFSCLLKPHHNVIKLFFTYDVKLICSGPFDLKKRNATCSRILFDLIQYNHNIIVIIVINHITHTFTVIVLVARSDGPVSAQRY